MQAFMLYMSGGGVQIFSMGIVFMLLLTPFKNIAGMNDGTYFISSVPRSICFIGVTSIRAIRPSTGEIQVPNHACNSKTTLFGV